MASGDEPKESASTVSGSHWHDRRGLYPTLPHETGRFSKAFESMIHMTPTQYRENLIQGGHPSKTNN